MYVQRTRRRTAAATPPRADSRVQRGFLPSGLARSARRRVREILHLPSRSSSPRSKGRARSPAGRRDIAPSRRRAFRRSAPPGAPARSTLPQMVLAGNAGTHAPAAARTRARISVRLASSARITSLLLELDVGTCLLRLHGRRNFILEPVDELKDWHRPQVFPGARAHGHRLRLRLTIAHDQHVWDLLQLSV